jgi:hypothetical protein
MRTAGISWNKVYRFHGSLAANGQPLCRRHGFAFVVVRILLSIRQLPGRKGMRSRSRKNLLDWKGMRSPNRKNYGTERARVFTSPKNYETGRARVYAAVKTTGLEGHAFTQP